MPLELLPWASCLLTHHAHGSSAKASLAAWIINNSAPAHHYCHLPLPPCRAPFPVFTHTPYIQRNQAALERFIGAWRCWVQGFAGRPALKASQSRLARLECLVMPAP